MGMEINGEEERELKGLLAGSSLLFSFSITTSFNLSTESIREKGGERDEKERKLER